MENNCVIKQSSKDDFCKCGYADCVCIIRKIHESNCYYKKIAESFVAFSCKEHNLEVCPECDKCSCSEEFKIEKLKQYQKRMIEQEFGPLFMNLPDRWYESPGPAWRCINGHVRHSTMKSELLGIICLACARNVILTYPEDKEC